MFTEVSHIALACRDFPAARVLYGRQLGLEDAGHDEGTGGCGACLLRVGPSFLELRTDPRAPVAGEVPNSASQTAVVNHFALYVSDLTPTYRVLKDRHVPFLDEPVTTPFGHRNMQRALVNFVDPSGLQVQLSQTVDPRPHLAERCAAKRRMAEGAMGLFGGFDHVSTYCKDFDRTRAFFRDQLGLDEFFHSTAREEGASLDADYQQSAFAIGGTDIELATCAPKRLLGLGTVQGIGFRTDDIDQAQKILQRRGLEVEGPYSPWAPLPELRGRAVVVSSPDGLRVRIVQGA